MAIDAGWYEDPAGTKGMARWWDGAAWTDQLRPVAPPVAPVSTHGWNAVLPVVTPEPELKGLDDLDDLFGDMTAPAPVEEPGTEPILETYTPFGDLDDLFASDTPADRYDPVVALAASPEFSPMISPETQNLGGQNPMPPEAGMVPPDSFDNIFTQATPVETPSTIPSTAVPGFDLVPLESPLGRLSDHYPPAGWVPPPRLDDPAPLRQDLTFDILSPTDEAPSNLFKGELYDLQEADEPAELTHRRPRRRILMAVITLCTILVLVGIYGTYRPPPTPRDRAVHAILTAGQLRSKEMVHCFVDHLHEAGVSYHRIENPEARQPTPEIIAKAGAALAACTTKVPTAVTGTRP